MELTPGVVIVVAVVALLAFAVIRWGRRHEAAAPMDAPRTPARAMDRPVDRAVTPVRSSVMAAGVDESRLVNWLLDRALEQTGRRVADDPLALQRIAEAALEAMEELRTNGKATINLPFLSADAQGPRHFSVELKRNADSTFEVER